MDYLFFDVECANCFEGLGKLCEFGYVLTDDKFNVLDEQSILINPDCKFDPYVIKKMLNFTEAEYKACPKFDVFYDKIISLITAKDRLVIGHTVGGDAKYFGADCMRYKLDPPDFDHIDLVEIYKGLNGQKDAVSLVKMSEIYELTVPEEVHSAVVDAKLTMLCMKEVVKNSGLSVLELVEKYPRAKGRLQGYKEEYTRKKLYKKFINECKKRGLTELDGEQKKLVNDFRRLVSAEGKFIKSPLRGKKVCISYNYEGYHYQNTLKIIQLVANRGGRCVARATKCDIFVRYDIRFKEGLVYCQRLEQAEIAERGGKKIEYISFDRLLSLLGVNENSLSGMPDIDVEKKLADRPKRYYDKRKRVNPNGGNLDKKPKNV